MMISLVMLQPVVALIAGILILMIPRLLNVIVGVYLILVGVIGFGPVSRSISCSERPFAALRRCGTGGRRARFPVIQFIGNESPCGAPIGICLFGVAACVEPPAAPDTAPGFVRPATDAGGYTVVITPPTAVKAKTAASAPVM